jgi:hypothetical protein
VKAEVECMSDYDYYKLRINIPCKDVYRDMIGYLSSLERHDKSEFLIRAVYNEYNRAIHKYNELSEVLDICRRSEDKLKVICENVTLLSGGETEDSDIEETAMEVLKRFNN